STHTDEEAIAALTLPIDYIAFGPVFSTSTKLNPNSLVGLEGLSRVRGLIADRPLVAIGGINESNLKSVFEAGADSSAIISCLISNPDRIEQKMRAFLRM
ncbi:MAG: thiamine phosphate synthase, partial [Pyrinomonadaceae bacterium]